MSLLRSVAAVAAVGSGVVGGVYYAFSSFVMRGLDDLAPADGVRAMQAINVAAPRPPLMIALLGTGVVSGVAVVVAVVRRDEPGAWWIVAGGCLYLVSVAITAAYHVPRNDALASLVATDPGTVAEWTRYVRDWTLANHVRTAVSVAGAALLTVGYGLA